MTPDIATLEQESRQVRARLSRIEAERETLLNALIKIHSMKPGNLIADIINKALAKVQA